MRGYQSLSGIHIAAALEIDNKLFFFGLAQNRKLLNLFHIGNQTVVTDKSGQIRRSNNKFRTCTHYKSTSFLQPNKAYADIVFVL